MSTPKRDAASFEPTAIPTGKRAKTDESLQSEILETIPKEISDHISQAIDRQMICQAGLMILQNKGKIQAITNFLWQIQTILRDSAIKDRFCVKTVDELQKIVETMEEKEIEQRLQDIRNQEWRWVLDITSLRSGVDTVTSHEPSRAHYGSLVDDLKAAKQAWEAPFKGRGHELLRNCITSMNKSREDGRFQSFTSIIQSSGMGKSRIVDEIAKCIFTIPLNLRGRNDKTGYPPSDTHIATFFEEKNLEIHDEFVIRFLCFFEALFEKILEKVVILPREAPEAFIETWRDEMQDRTVLYKKVAKSAENLFKERISDIETSGLLQQSAKEIKSCLAKLEAVQRASKECAERSALKLLEAISERTGIEVKDRSKVLLFIYFDEAHCLHDVKLTRILIPNSTGINIETEKRTAYYSLVSALDELSGLNIFSLFLSTASSLAHFAPVQQVMRSARSADLSWDLQPPFTELPFDIYTPEEPLAVEGQDSLKDVCQTKFMSRFGRPLFSSLAKTNARDADIVGLAKFKLLFGKDITPAGELAALSTRLLFDFEPRREEALNKESELVMNHMRVVFSIPKHRYYMRTGTPSEPVLAEAAAQIVFEGSRKDIGNETGNDLRTLGSAYRRRVIRYLNKWFTNDGLLEKGELGELVARTLLTLAHDLAIEDIHYASNKSLGATPIFSQPIPVINFIRALFREKHADKILESYPDNIAGGVKFKEAFKSAYVHFTHFGRTEAADVLRDECALAGMFRGMGWTFHRTQYGVDIGIPVFLGSPSEPLDRHKMTMIFFQVKNTGDPEKPEIDMESPKLNFFSTSLEGQADVRPYIVIVLNLGIRYAYEKGKKDDAAALTPRKPKPSTSSLVRTPDRSRQAAYNLDNTPSKLFTGSSEPKPMKKTRRKGARHPRYSVNAHGCSETVYRVIEDSGDKSRYALILKSRSMISEHPRVDQLFLNAIINLKPYWERGRSSFGWLKWLAGSESNREPTTQNVDDSVDVGRFREEEDEV